MTPSNGGHGTTGAQKPVYLQLEPDAVFAVLHSPSASTDRRVGVVLCAPFGWEEICAHRSFLRWAETLAGVGFSALRFDLPGTGDSAGSPRDPERLQAWTGAVAAAASWLKANAGCERVVAVGVGLGGMLAYLALTEDAPIDDLVLWSVPARGETLVREFRAMARLAADQAARPAELDGRPAQEGELEVWGFLLSADTTAALKQVNLTEREFTDPHGRRVLLLGRDQSPADSQLREHLEQTGAAVTSAPGPGYEAMMTQPKLAETPHKVFDAVTSWLQEASGGGQRSASIPAVHVDSADHIDLVVHETTVRESPFELATAAGRIRGVLTQPVDASGDSPQLCAVLLNSGAVRRIGVNRMWVEIARRWAARGVPTLRLDLLGLGDSDGDEHGFRHPDAFYRTEFCGQVVEALDALEAAGLPGSFVLSGLCAGAYWSFQTALVDERVRGTLLVNLWRFSTASELDAGRIARRARQLHRNGELWSTVRDAVADGTIASMFGAIARNPQKIITRDRHGEMSPELDAAMAQLHEQRVATLLLLSLGEPIAQDIIDAGFDETEPWPGVTLERIPIRDHNFRPSWAQEFVHEALDRGLERTVNAASDQLAAT
jgi:dienelactone hydrolase